MPDGGATYTVVWKDNPDGWAEVSAHLKEFISLQTQAQKLAARATLGPTYAAGGHGAAPTGHAPGAPTLVSPGGAPLQSATAAFTAATRAHTRAVQQATAQQTQQTQQARRQAAIKPPPRNMFADLPVNTSVTEATRRANVAALMQRYGEALGQGTEFTSVERRAVAQARTMQRFYAVGDRQRQRAAGAPPPDRNLFAGLEGSAHLDDKGWTELLKKRRVVEEEAVKNGTQLNSVEKGIIQQSNRLRAMMRESAEGGVAGKVASAVGWFPIPGGQNAYMVQMGLESLGVTGGALLAGTLGSLGVAAGAAGYVGVSNILASQMGQARTVAGITGGGNAAAVRPLDQAFAKQLRDIGYAYSLTQDQTYGLLPSLAPYNLPQGANPQNIADTLKYGLSVAGQAELTPQQGVQAVAMEQARTGQTAQQAAQALQRMNDAAQNLRVPLQQVNTDFLNLGGSLTSQADLTTVAALSAMGQKLGVTGTELAGGFMTSTGAQAITQAMTLGMSPQQFFAARQTPQGAAAIVARMEQMAQSQPNVPAAEMFLESRGFVQAGSAGENALVQDLMNGTANPQDVLKQLNANPPPSGAALANQTNANANAAQAISADTVNVQTRMAILAQQAGNMLFGNPATPAYGAPAPTRGNPFSGLGDWILNAVSPGMSPGGTPPPTPPADVNHNVTITITDANGKTIGQTTYSTGTTTRTPTVTPGQGTPPNLTTTPPSTPSAGSLTGR